MKFLATLFSLGMGLLLTSVAQAQVTFSLGPRVGVVAATARYQDDSHTYGTGYRAGVEAGLMGTIGWGRFALQPAVLYSQKGFTVHDSYDYGTPVNGTQQLEATYRFNYLTVPVNAVFSFRPGGQGWQVAAGGYLGVLLGGRFQSQTTYSGGYYTYGGGGYPPSAPTAIANEGQVAAGSTTTFGDDTFLSQRLDAGVQLSLGYRYQGFLLQAGYSLGLVNLGARYGTPLSIYTPGGYYYPVLNGTNLPPAYYNRAFQTSVSYLFGLKK